jgi:hypothetical protein
MRNKIPGALFNLSASLSSKATKQILATIPTLPAERQERIAIFTVNTILENIRELMKSGLALQKSQPPKYVQAAKKFQMASQFADSILSISETINSKSEKCELSEVYAQFASALKKHAPHLASKEEMLEKSLRLNPDNLIANELKVDMGFDEYIDKSNSPI